jgi:hypothetical protein
VGFFIYRDIYFKELNYEKRTYIFGFYFITIFM